MDKTAFKVINTNTDLIEFVPKTLVKKGVWKTIKYVGPFFHILRTGTPDDTNLLFYPHSDKNISIFLKPLNQRQLVQTIILLLIKKIFV